MEVRCKKKNLCRRWFQLWTRQCKTS